MSKKKGRGRPRLSNSDFQIVKSYRLPKKTWLEFKAWCSERGLKVTEVVRGSILFMMKEGTISELLEDSEMEEFAVEIIRGNLNKKKGVKEHEI